MNAQNIIRTKSFNFAIGIVNLYKFLTQNKKENVISKEILRSGTAIGASIEAAIITENEAEFFSKLSLAYQSAKETAYWIRLLRATNFITIKQANSILTPNDELIKAIGIVLAKLKNEAH